MIVGGELQGWGKQWYFSVVVHNQKDEGVESQSIDCATECSYTLPQVAIVITPPSKVKKKLFISPFLFWRGGGSSISPEEHSKTS